MTYRSELASIKRRPSRQIKVGNVLVGGDAPITVQSMTNTITDDINATVAQILSLEAAGVDMVRVSCPTPASSKAVSEIIKNINVPLIADIHFSYKRALEAADNGAHCLRINPGNIGGIDKVKEVVAAAKANNCAIRIGVNAGSLENKILEKYKDPCADAMVESAITQARLLEDCDFHNFKISVKASNMFLAVEAYRKLSQAIDCPLHLGITEAGTQRAGSVLSSIGIGTLLWEGIGDTLRVSLSADPVEEVKVGFDILKALDLRHKGIKIVSCPSCSRQGFNVIQFVNSIDSSLSEIKEPIVISILGCLVNGPGEAKESDIGIAGGGDGISLLYIDGKKQGSIKNENIIEEIKKIAIQKEQIAIQKRLQEKEGNINV